MINRHLKEVYNLKIDLRLVGLVLSALVVFGLHLAFANDLSNGLSMKRIISLLNLISLFQLIFISHIIRKQAGTINYMNIWILLAFLFYFGQFYCFPYVFDTRWSLFTGNRNLQFIIHSFFYSLESISIITVFYYYSYKKGIIRNVNLAISRDRLNIFNSVTRFVAKVMIVVCVIPTFIFKAYAIYLRLEYDYATMKYMTGKGMDGTIKYLSYFVGWTMPACYMLLIASRSRNERRISTSIMFLYVIMVLASGSRYEALEVICAYILILGLYYKKNIKRLIPMIVMVSFAMLVAFTVSRFFRTSSVGTNTYYGIKAVAYALFGDSAPASSINYAVIEYESRFRDYLYGKSYFYGVASVLISPIRNRLFPEMILDIGDKFSLYLGVTTTSLGSSVIAEGFYNFGWASLFIVMPLLGMILGRLVSAQRVFSDSSIPCCDLAGYIFFCTMLVFVIRSDLASIIRTYIVYALLPVLTIHIIAYFETKKRRVR